MFLIKNPISLHENMFMFLRTIHIILAFSVFVSSSGVSIPKDFCMKTFVKSIVHSFKGECRSEKNAVKSLNDDTKTACSTGLNCTKKSDNCPIKSFNIAKSDQDLETISYSFIVKKIDFQWIIPFVYRASYVEYCCDSKVLTYRNYHPPPLERDIVVLFQNFRC